MQRVQHLRFSHDLVRLLCWHQNSKFRSNSFFLFSSSSLHSLCLHSSLKLSSICIIVFSLYIHKSYLMKTRRQRVTLNHDATSALSSRQKYRLDAILASHATNQASSNQRPAENVPNPNDAAKLARRRLRREKLTVGDVVLQRRKPIDDNNNNDTSQRVAQTPLPPATSSTQRGRNGEFTSIERIETPTPAPTPQPFD